MRLPTRALLILLFSLLPATHSALAQAPDSTTEVGPGTGFRARIPGAAIVTRDSTVYPAGVVRNTRWTSSLDHPTYRVELAEYPAGTLSRFPPAQVLQEEVDKLVRQVRGTVKESREVTLGSHPGVAFTIATTGTELTGRYFVTGNRLYTLYVLYARSIGAPQMQAFLDSFEFVER
jgi:hypothetical protein